MWSATKYFISSRPPLCFICWQTSHSFALSLFLFLSLETQKSDTQKNAWSFWLISWFIYLFSFCVSLFSFWLGIPIMINKPDYWINSAKRMLYYQINFKLFILLVFIILNLFFLSQIVSFHPMLYEFYLYVSDVYVLNVRSQHFMILLF